MNSTLDQIGLCGIVPVVVINDARHAGSLAKALVEGGLPCIEVTFRTSAAPAALKAIATNHPAMLLGAGTVLTVDQVKQAVDLGARYIVSPGLNRKVVEYCLSQSIPVTPGVATPTEIEAALELGLRIVKFFPAEPLGGLAYLKAISAPFTMMKFIPTGGIDEANLLAYLKFPSVVACGGSWMVKAESISGGRFDEITAITSRAVGRMLGFTVEPPVGGPADLKQRLVAALALSAGEIETWTFAGTAPASGGRGDVLLVGTNFLSRARLYFERRGILPVPGSQEERDGRVVALSLDRKVGGHPIRLVQT